MLSQSPTHIGLLLLAACLTQHYPLARSDRLEAQTPKTTNSCSSATSPKTSPATPQIWLLWKSTFLFKILFPFRAREEGTGFFFFFSQNSGREEARRRKVCWVWVTELHPSSTPRSTHLISASTSDSSTHLWEQQTGRTASKGKLIPSSERKRLTSEACDNCKLFSSFSQEPRGTSMNPNTRQQWPVVITLSTQDLFL